MRLRPDALSSMYKVAHLRQLLGAGEAVERTTRAPRASSALITMLLLIASPGYGQGHAREVPRDSRTSIVELDPALFPSPTALDLPQTKPGDSRLLSLAVGTVGGMVAGGIVGYLAGRDPEASCDDVCPWVTSTFYGASIGALAGALAGWIFSAPPRPQGSAATPLFRGADELPPVPGRRVQSRPIASPARSIECRRGVDADAASRRPPHSSDGASVLSNFLSNWAKPVAQVADC